MLQVDGTLTRNTSCSESPAKGSSAANQSVFYNAPISNGSSVTPHKKRTAAAVSGNAKKAFDEVWMPAVVHNTPTDSDYCSFVRLFARQVHFTVIHIDNALEQQG